VEQLVNEKIREDIPLRTKVVTLEEGVREGAMAIFEEKYGEHVRMVTIGDFSKELCGGVHAASTGRLGLFKIVSEAGVAAGMRRVEALTGEAALGYAEESEGLLDELQKLLGASRHDLLTQVEKLKEAARERDKENKALRQKLARKSVDESPDEVRKIKGVSVIVKKVSGLDQNEVRELADSLKQKLGSGVVILGQADGPKAVLVVSVTKDLAARVPADKLIKGVASFIGGTGGGRPDFAQAGGSRPENLDQALAESLNVLEKTL
jgi:alanyl-tRNA synthetase